MFQGYLDTGMKKKVEKYGKKVVEGGTILGKKKENVIE